jgi:N-acetyl-anhydromuramoyl-L-alanine amidase
MGSEPFIDGRGIHRAALWRPSPHHDARPDPNDISLIVIHGISLPPGEFGGPYVDQLFMGTLDPAEHPYFKEIEGLRVSSHFVIRRDGRLVQYVACRERAWHAGASVWNGRERCNDFSIGIELEGADDVPYAEPQYDTLAALTQALTGRYGALGIAGHSDIAPGRKTDPGPWFDWDRYRASILPRS